MGGRSMKDTHFSIQLLGRVAVERAAAVVKLRDNDRPQGFAFSHQIKSIIYVIKFEFMGYHRLKLNFSSSYHFYDLWIVHRSTA